MPGQDNQKRTFEFLRDHFGTGAPFKREELQRLTDWNQKSFDTYWSKQLKGFVAPVRPLEPHGRAREQRYRVTDGFRRYARWNKFQEYVSQVRAFTSSDYSHKVHDKVLIYEFYLPLTNEAALRTTLDALFYKNSLMARLRGLHQGELARQVPREGEETDDGFYARVSDWLATKFIGYSITHVSGRFRAEKLATMQEAASLEEVGRRYLVDETTAVTRFIFPCDDDAERVAYFFHELFVNAITQFVNGEDEIWMVESGLHNRLHIWKV